jgi:hypothetical protein
MPRTPLTLHLSAAEKAVLTDALPRSGPKAKTRISAIIAASEGQDRDAIANSAGVSRRQLSRWFNDLHRGGVDAFVAPGKRVGRRSILPKPGADPRFEEILQNSRGPKYGRMPPLDPRTWAEEEFGIVDKMSGKCRLFIAQIRRTFKFTVSPRKLQARLREELGINVGYSTLTRYLRSRKLGSRRRSVGRSRRPQFAPLTFSNL